jgi:hypothetical protein
MNLLEIESLNSVEIKGRFFAFAVDLESTLFSNSVGAVENPVLPG